jgi:hypothetical protein
LKHEVRFLIAAVHVALAIEINTKSVRDGNRTCCEIENVKEEQ